MTPFRWIALTVALLALGVFAASASACSCAAVPDAERFAAAEAAFIGTLVERRDLGDPNRRYRSSTDPYVNVYRVDESFKGGFSGTVELRTAMSSATCGLDSPVGTQSAIYPRRVEGVWGAASCDVGTIAGMRAAAAAAAPKKPVAKRKKRKRAARRCTVRRS